MEPDDDLFAAFEAVAARRAGHLAIDDGIARIDYGELHIAARSAAARIAAAVPEGRLIAIAMRQGAECVAAILGCVAANRPFAVLDLRYPAARNAMIAADACFAAALVREGTEDELGSLLPGARILTVSLRPKEAPVSGLRHRSEPRGDSDIGFVAYTSGSTGRPKGVVHHRRMIHLTAKDYIDLGQFGPADRLLPLYSLCTIAGLRDAFAALLSGAELHMRDIQEAGLSEICSVMRQARITACSMVPALGRSFVRLSDASAAFQSLRALRIGGDAMFGSDIEMLRTVLPPQCRILLSYGTTEAGFVTLRSLSSADAVPTGRFPLGRPVARCRLTVVDHTGCSAAPGEPGELIVNGRDVAIGLWRNGTLDSAAFPSDADDAESRICRTGDLFRCDPDGLYTHLGRIDRQVKIRGMRTEPGELEAALRTLDGVRDAAVIAGGSETDVRLIALVVANDTAPDSFGQQVRRRLVEILPGHLRPAAVHMVEAIPRLPSFKVDGAAIERMLAGSGLEPPGTAG